MIEGKEILAKIEEAKRGQLRLGELADKLETQYGDRTLAKYAEALDIASCTLSAIPRRVPGLGRCGD